MNLKRSLLVGTTLATITAGGIGSIGLVSAASDTTSTSTSSSSLVDKIASKFKLNKSDVQAVFDEDKQSRQAQMEADQKQKLADAVTAGKLTQAQSDYITAAQAEIKTLRGTTEPRDLSDSVRDQIKTKMDALKKWADDNKVDQQYIMAGPGGHGGPGKAGDGMLPRGEKPADSTSSSSTSTTNTN